MPNVMVSLVERRRKVRRFVVIAASALALVTIGSAAAQSTVTHRQFRTPIEPFVHNLGAECLGESYLIEGGVMLSGGTFVETPTGRRIDNFYSTLQGVSAVGTLTGKLYIFHSVGSSFNTGSIDLSDPAPGAVDVTTLVQTLKIVSQGPGADFAVVAHIHSTFNAQGDLTVARVEFEVDCS
jgi:hypothetical protein